MSATATASDALLITDHGLIRTISINRPQKKNALNHEVELLIKAALEEAIAGPTRVIILTGEGGDFSAGADLSSGPMSHDVTKHLKEDLHPIVSAIRGTNKPVIAKVRGNCVGVGCNIALACDMIFASEGARFCQIFTKIGLATDGGGSYHMIRAMGWPKAFEYITGAKMISSAEAVAFGLINHSLPEEELDAAVHQAAERLATGTFVAYQMCKQNLREASDGTLQSALDQEAESQGVCFKSKDFAEGVMSFLQKRKPVYKGE